MTGAVSSTVLSVGLSEAYAARREAQRTQNDSPAFQESDRKLSRSRENAQDGRNSQSVEQISGKQGFSRELSPEQRKEADVIRRGDTRIRPYESAYLTRSYGAVASGGNFAVTYGADGKLSTTATASEGLTNAAPSPTRTPEGIRLKDQATRTEAPVQPVAGSPEAQKPRSITQAAQSQSPPPRNLAEAQVQDKIESAATVRDQREGRQAQQVERTQAATVQAKRSGEVQNSEPAPPSATANAIIRRRLADAYQTVPREAAASISLFV